MNINLNAKKKQILFLTDGFPVKDFEKYAFLKELVRAIASCGNDCTVIYPFSITRSIIRKEPIPPYRCFVEYGTGNTFEVYCPKIITISSSKILAIKYIQAYFNYCMFEWAVKRTIKIEGLKFNLVYGHFISPAGFVASKIGRELDVTSCLAYGENTTYTIDRFGQRTTRKKLKHVDAVVSVSTKNTDCLIENRIVNKDIIKTIPNAVNQKLFYKRDKALMRKKYKIPADVFLVIFVGYFTEIKGSLRLSKALDKLEDVHSIFVGNGECYPTCKNILFAGNVPHEKIPELLSAADVFVLPTIAEGCCNAIVEALSCGLPVISSDLQFNDDILDETCSVRINTTDIDEIANSIKLLKDNDKLRKKMGAASLKKSKNLDINTRAKTILEWIQHCESSKDEVSNSW